MPRVAVLALTKKNMHGIYISGGCNNLQTLNIRYCKYVYFSLNFYANKTIVVIYSWLISSSLLVQNSPAFP